jgi:hypothetical protein
MVNPPIPLSRRGSPARPRHRDIARGERVEDGAGDDSERRRASSFAAGLDSERVDRREHLDDLGREGRKIVRARQSEQLSSVSASRRRAEKPPQSAIRIARSIFGS